MTQPSCTFDNRRLAVVLSRRTRFDLANADKFVGPGIDFIQECAASYAPYIQHFYASDLATDLKPFYDFQPTHAVLAGEGAGSPWNFSNPLSTCRGFIHKLSTIRFIHTFHPQDCVDLRDYDKHYTDLDDYAESAVEAANSNKDGAITSRLNFPFWFRFDIHKLFNFPDDKLTHNFSSVFNRRVQLLRLTRASEAIYIINSIPANEYFYLDIETHPDTNTLQCFAFATSNSPVYGIHTYDHKGEAIENLPALMAAFVKVTQRATTVVHNIFFDAAFLTVYHGLPLPVAAHDTMLMWHRKHREAEKSLAHVMSAMTNLPYHKDESGTFHPTTAGQLQQLIAYNLKDVYGLREAHQALIAEPSSELQASFQQVNDSIPIYLRAGIKGFQADTSVISAYKLELQAQQVQLSRILSILTGRSNFNPTSPKQVGDYLFHDMEYKAPAKTETGEPKVDAASLYKLRLTHPENLVLALIIRYRDLVKKLGTLNMNLFLFPTLR